MARMIGNGSGIKFRKKSLQSPKARDSILLMNDLEIRVAIAIAGGWSNLRLKWRNWDGPDTQDLIGIPNTEERKRSQIYEDVPDYPNDRNAIDEEWRKLSYNQQAKYGHYLAKRIFGKGLADGKIFGEHDLSRMAHALARECCEAFLMSLGHWVEPKDS